MGNDIGEVMGGAFDTNSVPPADGFDPIPAGWYPCMIDSAEVKPTKAKNGKFLAIELTVVGEQYAGRKLWPRLNISNPNPTAEQIGRRELAAIGQALGLAAITDSSEIIGKTLMARVSIRKEEGHEPDNEVKGYKAVDGAAAPAAPAAKKTSAPAAATPAAPAAAASGAKPKGKFPWEK